MAKLRARLATAGALGNASLPACLVEAPPGGCSPDPTGLLRLDIALEGGAIAALSPAGSIPGAVGLEGRMVLPCFVDIHTHLDKGHIWPRAANPDGSFMGALETVRRDREANWSAQDVEARAEFALRCAYAHGTRAIRTHLDSIPPQGPLTWELFSTLRDRWRGRIELQGVALAMQEHWRGAGGEWLADLVAAHGGIMGNVPLMLPELEADLDRFFELAMERGLAIDCHIDEDGDPSARALRRLAEAAIRHGYRGRIVAGHCCSLACQAPDEIERTLDLVAEAGIAVVSLPTCNLYLQDRASGRTPRWRGITLLHELKAHGIAVAVASDNTRDPFYAWGDLDMHEVWRQATRIAHLDHPIGDWPRAVTATPAALMGLRDGGVVRAGAPADLVILEGRTYSETLSRPESRRIVLRSGRPIDAEPPTYAELDALFG
jgi:cytosine/creatinine deaminase